MELIICIILLIVTACTGTVLEKIHYSSIKSRELAMVKYPAVNMDVSKLPQGKKFKKVSLVTGEVVISADYFKTFASQFHKYFGGDLRTYESVLDRARREAILRLREKAKGFDLVTNIRVESCMMNNIEDPKSIPQCAVIAYGTAISYEL